jgi:gluconolactonase
MIGADQIETFAEGLDHPEGVAVHPDGSVWAGGEAGQIYRIPREGGAPEEVVRIEGGFILGIAFSPDCRWLAICDLKQHCVHRLELSTRKLSVLTKGTEKHSLQIPNYPAFRKNGELFVSESGLFNGKTGLMLRVLPNGATEIWHPGPFQFANGISFSPEERFLYLVETFGNPGVTRIALNADGSAGKAERFANLPQSVPDGMAFGADGTLYATRRREFTRLIPKAKQKYLRKTGLRTHFPTALTSPLVALGSMIFTSQTLGAGTLRGFIPIAPVTLFPAINGQELLHE